MYYICYSCPSGDLYETVMDEDAMQQRIDELVQQYNLNVSDIHVFRKEDERQYSAQEFRVFMYQDAYKDIVDYLCKISDEHYVKFGTTRDMVMDNKGKLEALATEHYKCVTQYGVDREWSCKDACESAPGFWA